MGCPCLFSSGSRVEVGARSWGRKSGWFGCWVCVSQPQASVVCFRFGVVASCGPGTSVTPCFSPVVASRFSAHTPHICLHKPEGSLYCGQRSEWSRQKPIPKQLEGGRTNSGATIMGSEHLDFVKPGRPLKIVLSDVFLKGFGLSVFRRVERV